MPTIDPSPKEDPKALPNHWSTILATSSTAFVLLASGYVYLHGLLYDTEYWLQLGIDVRILKNSPADTISDGISPMLATLASVFPTSKRAVITLALLVIVFMPIAVAVAQKPELPRAVKRRLLTAAKHRIPAVEGNTKRPGWIARQNEKLNGWIATWGDPPKANFAVPSKPPPKWFARSMMGYKAIVCGLLALMIFLVSAVRAINYGIEQGQDLLSTLRKSAVGPRLSFPPVVHLTLKVEAKAQSPALEKLESDSKLDMVFAVAQTDNLVIAARVIQGKAEVFVVSRNDLLTTEIEPTAPRHK